MEKANCFAIYHDFGGKFEIPEIPCDTLSLDLTVKLIGIILPGIANLKSLTKLDLSYNEIKTIPPEIGDLDSLTNLAVFYNKIKNISSQIGNLQSLQKLQIYKNAITRIPPEIGMLRGLREISSFDSSVSIPGILKYSSVSIKGKYDPIDINHIHVFHILPRKIRKILMIFFTIIVSKYNIPIELCHVIGYEIILHFENGW